MAAVAAFPTTAVTLAQLFGELPNFPELTLSGAHNASTTSIVVTTAIPATWPQAAWITIDTEILRVTSWAVSTFTVAARDGSAGNSQTTTAASHSSGAKVGLYLTAATVNQILAEIIALETQALGGIHNPNLVLNSDFSRRTVFGLAMPEVFADLSGTTKIDAGAAGAVASNIFTQGAANNEYAWCAGSFVWRDGRASATFKATAIAGIYEQRWRISATDYISVKQNNGNFTITKFIASALTVVSTVANVLTINRWYWIELDKQGTTVNARIYDTGGTVPGVTKASSTLITAANLTATIADASVAVGASVSITSDQAAAQWGGIATGNGGVYVETWLPESCAVAFGGTLGGQAIGFDEAADSGPLSKQWAVRTYTPATSRTMQVTQYTQDGSVNASGAYAAAVYLKTSGKGGSGEIVRIRFDDVDTAKAVFGTNILTASDASEAAWTRKTGTGTTASTARRARIEVQVNQLTTATGTAYFMLPQLEQGSAATAWRNAPEDGGSLVGMVQINSGDKTTTSAANVEIDSRDGALNFFLPWDATVRLDAFGSWVNSGANLMGVTFKVDGADIGAYTARNNAGTTEIPLATGTIQRLAAGKHRIAVVWSTAAGTATMRGSASYPFMLVATATRGK